ncbi:DUF4007 family protein [Thermoleptolyngbya sichuanensis A183]|uniref:DUF4007 family protein n=1 Tax=Thermoleptolyngbya sichuanensis A183 TaxID=2737172 RepID=A0A6M8BAU4_9CYAN|nr:DUF4007 family protein [Thermoleptolyngbya sichuanensis]QKD81927.1 DUF4007 family protein [Thermoleptolyngbya sichuanensis A183]
MATESVSSTTVNQGLAGRDVSRPCIFARHETFHPRFGWLKKGFDRASIDSEIFLREDAPVRLGVGKNMVRSIRYWCSAFKLLKDDQPTEFGQQLLGQDGWDSYLEDPASLWLLHWKLLEAPNLATAWDVAFNDFRLVEFTAEDLFYQLCEYRDRVAPRISDSSLKKDVSCILRMYVVQPSKKAKVSEDSLDCPFTELGLIYTAGDSRHYRFRVGQKPSLPPEIVVYACLEHHARTGSPAKTIPIANLLYDLGSPGLVFKLTESAICDAIEVVARRWNQIRLSDAAGKLQFSFEGEPLKLAAAILDGYYRFFCGDAPRTGR